MGAATGGAAGARLLEMPTTRSPFFAAVLLIDMELGLLKKSPAQNASARSVPGQRHTLTIGHPHPQKCHPHKVSVTLITLASPSDVRNVTL